MHRCDETTDTSSTLVGGFVVSSLEKPNCEPFLINIGELD